MSVGGPVHTYRTSSQVDLFTCMFHSHVQLLFTLGRDSKWRDCEFIDHCSGLDISTFSYCVLSVAQAFVIANTCKYQL